MRWMTALGLLTALFVGCENETSTGSPAGVDGGPSVSLDGSAPSPLDASTSDAVASDGSVSDASTSTVLTGRYIRFTHLAESMQADQIDFCIAPKDSDAFTLVYGPMGAPGLHYGEVGRFVPIVVGEHDLRMTTTGDCEDYFESTSLGIPTIGTYVRLTYALTLTSTGVISVQAPDYDQLRDPAQDRITLLDGTGPRGATTPLAVSWVGSSTVDLSIPNNTRSTTALLPAGQTGNLVVNVNDGPTQRAFTTVAGGHAMVVIYGAGLTRVCDYHAPEPTTGVLGTCNERN